MSETYSKLYQVSKMMRHIENPGIVRTVYSGIFMYIKGHSAIFSHVQPCQGTLRHIQANVGIIKAYRAIFRHIENSV